MIKRCIIILMLASLVPHYALAVAPDVDAIKEQEFLEDDEISSVASNANSQNLVDETPLAKDDSDKTDTSEKIKLVNQLQGLQQELAELRGRIDEQTQLLQKLQEQQLSLYKDLDARVSTQSSHKLDDANVKNNALVPKADSEQLSPPASQINSAGQLPKNTSLNSTNEQMSYLAAYDFIKNKQYANAIKAMKNFIQTYPQSGYLPNAHYWLGELYMSQHNNTQAINHFEWVLHQYPESSKCSASLLKMGYLLADNGKIDEAKNRLHAVVNQYPDTHAAQMARFKLESLGG